MGSLRLQRWRSIYRRSWSGDITSVRLSLEKTGNGLFKVEMMVMRSELGRALSPEQSLSEVRMPQCEYAPRERSAEIAWLVADQQ